MRFHEKLKFVRNLRGLTLIQLSRTTGISNGYISKLETGMAAAPTIPKVKKLAEALNVTPDYLLNENAVLPQEVISEKDLPPDIIEWLMKEENMPYLVLGKELQEERLPASKVRKIVKLYRSFVSDDESK